MQVTEAKLEANRQNSQLSTGPITEAGKAISSRNACKHGLTAKHPSLLPDEDQADRDTLAAEMRKHFDPYNSVERELIDQLIDFQWRLRRASRFEAEILSADLPDFKALNNMSLHAARLKRQFSTTLKEFQALHAAEAAKITANLERAAIVHKADQLLDRPSTLADHGFDFSLSYLENWMNRRAASKEAEDVVSAYKFADYVAKRGESIFDPIREELDQDENESEPLVKAA